MIFNYCLFKVSDNSNATYVKCFNVCSKSNNFIGSSYFVSVKYIKGKGRFAKGETIKGIVIRCRKKFDRQTGNFLRFDLNEVILFNEKNEIPNNRTFGVLPLELRRKKLLKLLCLSYCFI